MSDAAPAPAAPAASPSPAADGAPSSGGAPAVDAAAPPAPPPRDARIQASIDKARAAAAEKRAKDQQYAASTQRVSQQERQIQDMQRQLHEAAEWRERAKKDPLGHVRELGVDARTLAERAMQENTPEAALAALKAELAEMKADKQREAQERDHARNQQALQKAQTDFQRAAGDSAKYPTLASQPPRAVLALAEKVIEDARVRGIQISGDGEILDFLETHWSGYQKQRAAAVTQPVPHATSGAAPQTQAATPRTLPTNAAPPPLAADEIDPTLPEHEQRKKLVEIYERTLAASRR